MPIEDEPQAATAGPAPSAPRDGQIDFESYSLQQLRDLEHTIDRNAFPQNYRNLQLALAARADEPAAPAAGPERRAFNGRFSDDDGIRGWWQSRQRGCPVYGAGGIDVRDGEIVLHAWRRTWLGTALQVSWSIAADEVRNVIREGEVVRFERVRRRGLNQPIELALDSEDAARSLAALLPAAETAAFRKRWERVRRFNLRLRAHEERSWVTATIVVANVAVFAATLVRAYRFGYPDAQALLDWGGNFAALTGDGQWWRLFSGAFLHTGLPHLFFNMWALWNVGRLTERFYGHWIFLGLYALTAAAAGLASIAWDPSVVSVGASGAVFGVFGAFLAFLANPRSGVPAAMIRAHWISSLAFVAFNLTAGALQDGVDNAAHVGGLLSGFVLGWFAAGPFDPRQRSRWTVGRTMAATAIAIVILVLGGWNAREVASRPGAVAEYWRMHAWYVDASTANGRRLQQLLERSGRGEIAGPELARRLRSEVLAPGEALARRLQAEPTPKAADSRRLVILVQEHARSELDYLRSLATAVEEQSRSSRQQVEKRARAMAQLQAQIERLGLRSRFDNRRLGIANSAPVRRLRRLFAWTAPTCVRSPRSGRGGTPAADSPTDGPAVRDRLGCEAQRLFLAGDYRALDRLFTQGMQHLGDLPDGGSSYDGVTLGLTRLMQYGGLNIEQVLARTSDWRRDIPGSIAAELTEVEAFSQFAWAARGEGTASTVSPMARQVFAYRTAMAFAGLREIAPRAAASSPWFHELMIDVGLDQSLDLEDLQELYDLGVERFPRHWELHRAMLRVLMPRWRGSFEEVEGLINRAYATGGADAGLDVYARLYWIYVDLEGDELESLDETQANWEDIRDGFEQLLRRHPTSDYILNGYAYMACRAGDASTYRALAPRVTRRPSSAAWSERFTPQYCDRKFAASQSAPASARDPATT